MLKGPKKREKNALMQTRTKSWDGCVADGWMADGEKREKKKSGIDLMSHGDGRR